MRFRKHCLPRTCQDIFSFLFISIIVPFGYCFELFYVLPTIHSVNSLWYILHAALGSFVLVNIASNLLFMMIIDTAVEKKTKCSEEPFLDKIPEESSGIVSHKHRRTAKKRISPGWKFCDKCQTRIPPRAWHCKACNCCILKRDHHCQFAGCCIGHRNHRYFFFFVLYMVIGTMYAFYFHTLFIYQTAARHFHRHRRLTPYLLISIIRSFGSSINTCIIHFYGIVLFGMGTSLFFLYYHGYSIARGLVTYERSYNIHDYDSGSIKKNIVQVLGERWYLTWISPLVSSTLPGDGINWSRCNPNKRMI